MNWFKRKFGKRNWKTIYQRKCKAKSHNILYGCVSDEIVIARFVVDKERKLHKCYITDGTSKSYYHASYFAALFEDFIPYFEQENIKY